MQRTAPWPEDSSSRGKRVTPSLTFEYRPLSETFHDPSNAITGTFDRLAIINKTKVKTRGTGDNRGAAQAQAQPPPPNPTSTTVYHVAKGSMPIFRALFHSPGFNPAETPSKIA